MTRVERLGDYCRVIAGQSPNGSAYNDSGKGMEFHQGKKAFGKDILDHSGVWTTEITKVAEPGDILMSVRAPVGPTNTTNRQVCIGRGLAAIRCSNRVLPKYVLYCLKNIESGLVGKDGAVFNSINKNMIEDLPIPYLSLPEQQRIVDILDSEFARIETIIANSEKNLQHAKDLFQALMKKELKPKKGWKQKRIGDLCIIYNGGTPSTSKEEYWNGGIQWITPKDMGKSTEMYVAQCERTISNKGVENSSAKVLPERSVIVSSRAPIGYVAINSVPMATNQGCKGFIPGKELYPEFLYYFFLSSTELLNQLGTGATFKEVSGKKLADITIDYPAFEEQQRIANLFFSLSQACFILQEIFRKTLALCTDLKQALLRKAFNGEL